MQETPETGVHSLDWGDPLEKEMTTHSSIHAWKYKLPASRYLLGPIRFCVPRNQCLVNRNVFWHSRNILGKEEGARERGRKGGREGSLQELPIPKILQLHPV